MLQLVSNLKWTQLNPETTQGIEMYHRDYGNNLHGVVFVDEEGGNSVLMDSENNIIDRLVSSMYDFESLQERCDNLLYSNVRAV